MMICGSQAALVAQNRTMEDKLKEVRFTLSILAHMRKMHLDLMVLGTA